MPREENERPTPAENHIFKTSLVPGGYSIRSDTTYNTTALHNVEIHTPSQRVYAAAEFNITFTLDTHDRPLKFALKPNNDLLFQTPHIQFTNTNGGRRTEVLKRNNHRVFKGEVLIQRQSTRWETVGWTRINVLRDGIDPLFNGAFSIAGTQYDVKATANKMLVYYPPDETIDLASNISSSPSIADHYLAPQKRQFTFNSDIFIDSIGDNSGCPSSREIALVGIATDCTYTASFDSSEDLVDAIVSMVNTASEVFENTFNIALALHNLTIEEEECPSTASSDRPWNAGCSAGDLNWRLQAFSEWRGSVRDENAYWTLMSGCSTGSEVGVSWVGELCSEDTATNVVARAQNQWQIFAHESAHTFGAYHDCDASTCSFGRQCCPLSASSCNANGQYLMNPVSTSPQQEFSQCTVGNVCAAMGAGRVRTDCLTTNTNTPTISAGECGNGIVEVGEECDCGDECDGNSCCDGSTCRFIGDAVCDDSAGECCTQCQFASSGTVCRDSVSECDIEETCPGDSGVCPDDEQRPDGETCGNDSDLFSPVCLRVGIARVCWNARLHGPGQDLVLGSEMLWMAPHATMVFVGAEYVEAAVKVTGRSRGFSGI
ncbi:Metallo-peptidase family M12-domain-containing protein [Aspergillus cavernicola]|uniref:Metallo-peptidase family M12-domain-containing protein n=1 Tax=Aspergillus cavernicola TaxID=176166 RepID=A0ABR4HQY4_9EURO